MLNMQHFLLPIKEFQKKVSMEKEELLNIAKNFKIEGEPIDVQVCSEGHINKTYVITYKKMKR